MRKSIRTALQTERSNDYFDKSLQAFASDARTLKSTFIASVLVRQMRGLNLWPLLDE